MRKIRRRSNFVLPTYAVVAFCLVLAAESVAWAQDVGAANEPLVSELTSDRLDADDQRELDHLLEDLRDPLLDLPRRQRAARILLNRGWGPANTAVRRVLIYNTDEMTRRAVARGIANSESPDPRLADSLIRLLGEGGADLDHDVATALSRFRHPKLVERLGDIAEDGNAATNRRLAAVQALGWHRTQASVERLFRVLHAQDEDTLFRNAVTDALEQLTGISEYGKDVTAWRNWWNTASQLDERNWMLGLMQHITQRDTELGKNLQNISRRLKAAYAQLYDATPEAGRQAVVQRMLVDELPEIRHSALLIIEQRLHNAQTISDAVRLVMRDRLTDRSSMVRAQAAFVLESLKDEPAAEATVELLAAEPDPTVQAAYLRLLARLPQRDAVPTVLQMLELPEVSSGACDFILAAKDADLLSSSDLDLALSLLRSHFASGQRVVPSMLRLLGHIGTEEDLPMVALYLEHTDPAIRIAAADAFDNGIWPLTPLYGFLNDTDLRPSLWKLFGKRGRSMEVIAVLLDHQPREAEQQALWLTSLTSIASRLSPEDVAKVSDQLTPQAAQQDILEAMLRSAAGLSPDGTPLPGAATPEAELRKAEADIQLAEFYSRNGEPAKAKLVYTRLNARTTLPVTWRNRVQLSHLKQLLQQATLDDAASISQTLMSDMQAPSVESIIAVWLDAAETLIAGGGVPQAQALLSRLSTVFSGKIGMPSQERLTQISKKLAPASP